MKALMLENTDSNVRNCSKFLVNFYIKVKLKKKGKNIQSEKLSSKSPIPLYNMIIK